MAAAIDSLRAHLSRPRRPAELLADCLLFGLFLLGSAYLCAKAFQLAGDAGYDFKYIWLAGEAWQRGLNPYAEGYHALGKELVSSGHVPDLWLYPPNWYLPALLIGLPALDSAALLWNLANIVMLLASSALLAAAMPAREPADGSPFGFLWDRLRSPWNAFFLHFFALAALQASALTLSVGQTSILIYFGVSLLLFGILKQRQVAAVLGLTILLLKPQLAIVFVAAMAVDRTQWALLAKAIGLSAVISLPAFVIAPTAAFDWLGNLPHYDTFTSADWPQSATGLRHLVWSLTGYDLGSIPSIVIAAILMVALYAFLVMGNRSLEGGENAGARSRLLVLLASAVTIAVAPLHVYDLPLTGVLLFVLARARPLEIVVGLFGAALLWRAGDLAKLTGFYGEGTEHFEGTRLATLGALLILAAVFETIRRQRV